MRVVITGANSGIGKEAAVQYASLGYDVVMACRSRERAEAAREEIVKRAGAAGSVEAMVCDLSSQASIAEFAERFAERFGELDVLINNAAHFDLAQKERQFTAEGHESVWATNHLGPFLLSHLLLPALASSAGGGRIANVSSKGLLLYPFLKLDLEDPALSDRKFSVQRSYYHSKLAVVISSIDLARRFAESNVTVNTIRVTNVRIDVSRYPNISDFQKKLYAIKSRRSIEPSEMAETYAYVGDSEKMSGKTGLHIDENQAVLRYRKYELDPAVQERLYELSKRSTGLA